MKMSDIGSQQYRHIFIVLKKEWGDGYDWSRNRKIYKVSKGMEF